LASVPPTTFIVIIAAVHSDIATAPEAAGRTDLKSIGLGRIKGGCGPIAGDEIGQFEKISAIQRDTFNGLRCDLALDHRFCKIEIRRRCVDIHRRACTGDLQFCVGSRGATRFDRYTIEFADGESRNLDLKTVDSGRKIRQDVKAAGVCDGLASRSLGCAYCRYMSAHDDRLFGIQYKSIDASVWNLCVTDTHG
jgi:hypothetical protein